MSIHFFCHILEFQPFVISSLSKLKFEISNMSSTVHTNHISSEAF